jgi:LPS sulfotransferase NodH
MRAGRSLIICASQRTGSTLIFDDLLNVVGCEAANAEILYDRIVLNRTARPWIEVWNEVSKINRVREYFIGKVMFHYTPRISQFIERNSTVGAEDCLRFQPELFDAFPKFFADAVWVFVDRRNVFAQTASMYLTEKTQIWEQRLGGPSQRPGTLQDGPLVYDYEKLKPYLQVFLAEKKQWQVFFEYYNISPIKISYEEAATDYPCYLSKVLSQTGLQMIEALPQRRLLKLGNELNEKWAELLRNDFVAECVSQEL